MDSHQPARTDAEVAALQNADKADTPRVPAGKSLYKEGDEVEVFYRLLEEGNGGYFPCATPTDCLRAPRLARTDGWVPAVVVRTHQGWADELIVVRHMHPHWRDHRGDPLDMSDDENAACGGVKSRPRRASRRALS